MKSRKAERTIRKSRQRLEVNEKTKQGPAGGHVPPPVFYARDIFQQNVQHTITSPEAKGSRYPKSKALYSNADVFAITIQTLTFGPGE